MKTIAATAAPAPPGGRTPHRVRTAAVAALGVVCAAIVAAEMAIGGEPMPPPTPAAPAASAPTSPASAATAPAMISSGGT